MAERQPTAARTVERGEEAPAPEELYLEVTNRCNLRCRTCPQYFGMAERSQDLSWERFLAITDQFARLRRVVLHGIGEPLLNPALARMVRHLKARDAYVLFNSNGLLLHGRKATALAASGLDELRVSIDGATPETYRAVRGVDGFERILRNLGEFRERKAALGVSTPRVSLWLTGMLSNVAELPQLVRLAATSGASEVYLQRLVFSGRGLALRSESLWSRADREARAAVAEAERLARELGLALHGSGELGSQAADDRPAPAAPWHGCSRPWRLIYVTANGTVLPCCIAPFTAAPYASLVLGDLNRQSVAEVWAGEAYRSWRRAMRSEAPPPPCRNCGVEWSL